jgi:MOSC domain-containing protein YiiM
MQNKKGSVMQLFISSSGVSKRVKKDMIELDFNGVLEDKFYGKNNQRSILLTSLESYILANKNGISASFGSLGENILVDIDLYHLKVGERLQIGSSTLEITQNCTICHSLSKVDKALPKLLESSRGVFAKIINGSIIRKDDIVHLS